MASSAPVFAQTYHQSQLTENQLRLIMSLEDCPDLGTLINQPDWHETLGNAAYGFEVKPNRMLRTTRTISDHLNRLQRAIDTGQFPGYLSLPDQLEDMRYMSEIIAAYLDSTVSGPKLRSYDFATSSNPALWAMRTETQLPPPPGCALIRFYFAPGTIPPELVSAFNDPNTLGVTIYCRYILMLEFVMADGIPTQVPPETVNLSVSHELVHAYINSSLGMANIGILPKWFTEGTALYVANNDRSKTSKLNDEYSEYIGGFRFLERTLGRPELMRLIGASVKATSPDTLLRAAGVNSFNALIENDNITKQADRDWQLKFIWLPIGALFGLFLLRSLSNERAEAKYKSRFRAFSSSGRIIGLIIEDFIQPVQFTIGRYGYVSEKIYVKNPSILTCWSAGEPGSYWVEAKIGRLKLVRNVEID